MSIGIGGELARLAKSMTADVPGAPDAAFVLAPESAADLARVLDLASEHRLSVLPWGGGEHQGIGGRVDPDVVLSTARMTSLVAWEPDDLTVVVEAGMAVRELESTLAERGQTALLPESTATATVGGVVAAGVSGYRRLRYGPTRDRMLEVQLVTGDGRVVLGGGRVVKNVTGFDIPRLATGSFGSLGLITRVAIKLWPVTSALATVIVDDPERALDVAWRPLAVLDLDGVARVYLAGTEAELEGQLEDLGGDVADGLLWPDTLDDPVMISIRVPRAWTADAAARAGADHYIAAHGVGEVLAGYRQFDADLHLALRSWAESIGGATVVTRAPKGALADFDPWGTAPPTLALQRRIKAAFDPIGVMVPGRLAGGL